MKRRSFLAALVATLSGALIADQANAQIGMRARRARRRIHRRIRRRIRRRTLTRIVLGRPFWVVPVGLAVGWELVHDNRVVVVKETRIIERDGAKVEVAMVQDSSGKTEQVDLLREDTVENSKDIEGSVLPNDDKVTPGIDGEIEEEVG